METAEKVAGSENPEVENDLATVPKPLERLTTARACSAGEGIGLFQQSPHASDTLAGATPLATKQSPVADRRIAIDAKR